MNTASDSYQINFLK